MNRKLINLLIVATILLPVMASAQYENVWAFGIRAGLDFNNGSPIPYATAIEQVEGSASICDEQGKLLFYSEGNNVWDRQHNLMPNGDSIVAANERVGSSTQAALIVPHPGSSYQYYLFSTSLVPSLNSYWKVKLYYSVIDMTLNNGMGDIVPGKKGIVMDSSLTLTEKLTAIPGANCNVWVIVCRNKTNTYLAYEVNTNGLNATPVVSNSGANLAQAGCLLGSPNHRKLVAANSKMNPSEPRGLILSDFNPATGIVSNSIQLDASEEYYGVGFSPDNSKLYVTTMLDRTPSKFSRLWQFDLSAPNPASARTLLATGEPNFISSVKLGPNQKVYVGINNARMGVVNLPNEAGTACQYVSNGVAAVSQAAYAQGASIHYGVPNVIPVLPRDTISRIMADTICDATPLTATDTTGRDYTWNDGSTGKQLTITSSGTYWVTYHTPCTYHQDSFHVYLGTSDTVTRYSIVPDPGCFIDEVTLRPATPGYGYQWRNGSTNAYITVTQPGIYWVRYSGDSCVLQIDSFEVHLSPEYLPGTGTQSSCKNDSSGKAWVIPRAGDTVRYQYTWLDAYNTVWATGDSLLHAPAGSYRLRITTAGCDTAIPVLIPVIDYPVAFTTDMFTCVSDPLSFKNQSHPYFTDYTWWFGDNGFSRLEHPVYIYKEPGVYRVTLVGKGMQCSDSAFAIITADPRMVDTTFITDRDTICLGDIISCVYYTDSTVTGLSWDFGDGSAPIQDKETVQHRYPETGALPIRLTVRFRVCPERILTDTVYVFALPVVDLGPDTAVCQEAFPLSLSNLATADPADRYRWHTGATTRSLKINEYGRYSLTVTSGLNCIAADEIEISKDCYLGIPNIFTPNGDGINDFFFPREALAGNLVSFSMQIFNRWGQIVYETRGVNGKGWDGSYKGADQPAGVFVYLIEAGFGNGRQEKYQGNLTLMR